MAECDGLATVADGDGVGPSAGDEVWNGAALDRVTGLALAVCTATDPLQPDAARAHTVRTAKNGMERRKTDNSRGTGRDLINIPKYPSARRPVSAALPYGYDFAPSRGSSGTGPTGD